MALEFRPAGAADVIAAVPLILSSGPEAFGYVFEHSSRGRAEDFLRHAFLDAEGEFGYRNHVVGVRDGEVVAAGAAWSGAQGFAFMQVALRQILGQYGLVAAPGVLIRGLKVEGIIRPPNRKEWYLAHLGVRPDLRGQGIGRALIDHLLERGREAGLHEAALDVALTNPRAEILYERAGFKVTSERKSTLASRLHKVPSHRRMARSL
jgi:ribosomal protein S18 acetylase RimI-like enzyme